MLGVVWVMVMAAAPDLDSDLAELLGPVSPTSATETPRATPSLPYDAGFMLKLSMSQSVHDPNTALLPGDGGAWDVDTLLVPRDGSRYGALAASFFGELELGSQAWLGWLLDSGELRSGASLEPAEEGLVASGRPLRETMASLAWIKELYVQGAGELVSLAAGRKRSRVGDGLVYDDYGTGLWLEVALGDDSPVSLSLAARIVGDRFVEGQPASPLLSASLDYELSPFESIGVFGASFVDRGDALRDVLASAVSETVAEQMQARDGLLAQIAGNRALDLLFEPDRPSHGRVNYLGLGGNLVPHAGLSLSANGVVSFGRLSVTGESGGTYDLKLRGYAADAEARAEVSSSVSVAALGFVLSGDQPPALRDSAATYGAFVAVAPFWTWTGLFFSGGLNQGFYASRAASAGVNGHGVGGGGGDFSLSAGDFDVDARLVWLQALAAPPALDGAGDGHSYGLEGDLRASWKQSSYLTLATEIDALRPGGFFASDRLAYRALALVYVDVD